MLLCSARHRRVLTAGSAKIPEGFGNLNPVLPSSSSSSLPLSPTEEKMGSRLAATGSSSPGSNRINGDESPPSSSSRQSSLSPPATGSVFGSSHLCSPSPNGASEWPANPTTNAKWKMTSRTREIVDQLRSSSVDAGKDGVGLEGSGWRASSSANGEMESVVSSGHLDQTMLL
ncbi:hypothetical protein JVU11DRAFT_7576 [Chiua virens]|nr:hypothetical protein JVU11DRAFT_7576 [Chiua virens]